MPKRSVRPPRPMGGLERRALRALTTDDHRDELTPVLKGISGAGDEGRLREFISEGPVWQVHQLSCRLALFYPAGLGEGLDGAEGLSKSLINWDRLTLQRLGKELDYEPMVPDAGVMPAAVKGLLVKYGIGFLAIPGPERAPDDPLLYKDELDRFFLENLSAVTREEIKKRLRLLPAILEDSYKPRLAEICRAEDSGGYIDYVGRYELELGRGHIMPQIDYYAGKLVRAHEAFSRVEDDIDGDANVFLNSFLGVSPWLVVPSHAYNIHGGYRGAAGRWWWLGKKTRPALEVTAMYLNRGLDTNTRPDDIAGRLREDLKILKSAAAEDIETARPIVEAVDRQPSVRRPHLLGLHHTPVDPKAYADARDTLAHSQYLHSRLQPLIDNPRATVELARAWRDKRV